MAAPRARHPPVGAPDGRGAVGAAPARSAPGALRRHRPDIVLTMNFDLPWAEDGQVNHSDHRAVGLATLDASRDAANSWLFPEAGAAWNGVKATYVATTANPTHYVDVTDTIEAGVASLREHKAYL